MAMARPPIKCTVGARVSFICELPTPCLRVGERTLPGTDEIGTSIAQVLGSILTELYGSLSACPA
jgi:hypothetical protein